VELSEDAAWTSGLAFVTTGNGKILSLSEQGGKKDTHGRLLKHNATIEEVHKIVVEECDKVHQFYLVQLPAFVARMIQDALVGYGLLQPLPSTDIVPAVEPPTEPPAEPAS
jgi:hypothetical protein